MSPTSRENKDSTSYDENLKGTFVSTIIIGAFVFLTWLIIFYIYMTTI